MRKFVIFSLVLAILASYNTNLSAKDFKKRVRQKNRSQIVSYQSEGHLELKNVADVGFGALVFSILTVLDEFEKGKMQGVSVNFDSGCYLDPDLGPNWWEYFFEPISIGNDHAPLFHFTQKQMLLTTNQGYRMPRNRSTELAQKYIILKPFIQEEIDHYVEQHFQGYYVIGIHHRGTDKKTETPLVPFERTLKALNNQIAALSPTDRSRLRIYVATDEQAFLDKIIELYPSNVAYSDFVRSTDGKPLHYSQGLYGSNYQKGREAILDCFLLSQCQQLIHPASSSYSLLAAALNCNMETVPLSYAKHQKL